MKKKVVVALLFILAVAGTLVIPQSLEAADCYECVEIVGVPNCYGVLWQGRGSDCWIEEIFWIEFCKFSGSCNL